MGTVYVCPFPRLVLHFDLARRIAVVESCDNTGKIIPNQSLDIDLLIHEFSDTRMKWPSRSSSLYDGLGVPQLSGSLPCPYRLGRGA
jgi:hypothetical protein